MARTRGANGAKDREEEHAIATAPPTTTTTIATGGGGSGNGNGNGNGNNGDHATGNEDNARADDEQRAESQPPVTAAEAAVVTTTTEPLENPSLRAPIATTSRSAVATAVGKSEGMPPRFPPFRESYSDMGELRRELKVISVQLNVPYYMHHSSPQRLEARCPTWKHRKDTPSSCEFVVAANRHTNGRVYVTRALPTHSPACVAVQTSGHTVSAAALMETAKPFMQAMADTVKPRDMANIMKAKFGVSASYMTAWRALTAFKQERKVEESASFAKLHGYLTAFAVSNPGSVIAFEHVPESSVFARAFLCPAALQTSVRFCRAQLLLSIFLVTSTHGGVVMTATAQDAMGGNVPIAIALALQESEANWRFFLNHLLRAIPELDRTITTLVHNRGEELSRAAQTVCPGCEQSSAVDAFLAPPPEPSMGETIVEGGGAAATSITTTTSMSTSAPTPTISEPGHGSTTTPGALLWLETLCTKAPLMILVGWVSKVASTLYQRYETYGQMSSEYPEQFNALLTYYEGESKHYEVLRVAEHGYEVIHQQTGRQRIVDFAKQTCTCGEYDASRFPCLHVFLAVSFAGLVHTDVIPPIFLMDSLKSLYGGRVTPIDVETVSSDNVTVPHPVAKTRGRPRKVQQIQQFSGTKHERLACSVCGVKGHNKRTCKRVVASGSTNSSTATATATAAMAALVPSAPATATATAPATAPGPVIATSAGTTGIPTDLDESAHTTFLGAATYDEGDLHYDLATVPRGDAMLGPHPVNMISASPHGDSSPGSKRRKLTTTAKVEPTQPAATTPAIDGTTTSTIV